MVWVWLLPVLALAAAVYQLLRLVRRYREGQALAEAYGLPYEKQFLPYHAVILNFIPVCIASRFWGRDLVFSDTMVDLFTKHDTNILGLVSYTGLNLFVKLVNSLCLRCVR
jgi:hypothetical protein